jgi:hypothetical protein
MASHTAHGALSNTRPIWASRPRPALGHTLVVAERLELVQHVRVQPVIRPPSPPSDRLQQAHAIIGALLSGRNSCPWWIWIFETIPDLHDIVCGGVQIPRRVAEGPHLWIPRNHGLDSCYSDD